VYRKEHCHGKPVVAVTFKVDSCYKTLYLLAETFPPNKLPSDTTTKDDREEFAMIPWRYENWWRIRLNKLTPGGLGVGAYEWHSKQAIILLKKDGDPANLTLKVTTMYN
jgi:hypothetical protein